MTKQPRFMLFILFLAFTLTAASPGAAEVSVTDASPENDQSLTEVNKKLTNPVSDIWAITLQQNNYVLDIPGRDSSHWNSNLQFQPVMPVALTND